MRKLCKERKRKQSDGRSRSFFYRFTGARGPRSLDNQGLTLIEVIVSVAIFSIVAFPLITQLNTLMRGNYTAKVSQAETDLATRVMEQFKQADPNIILSSDGKSSVIKGQYVLSASGNAIVYNRDNLEIGKDIVLSGDQTEGYTPVRSNTKYNVKVTLDPDYYDAVSGNGEGKDTLSTYRSVNDSDYYNLDNIDERFAVVLKDGMSSYDDKAQEDLFDKISEQLKKNNPIRFNQWQSGAQLLDDVICNKYLYVTIKKGVGSQSSAYPGKECYILNAKVTYVTDDRTARIYLGSSTTKAFTYTLVNNQQIFLRDLQKDHNVTDENDPNFDHKVVPSFYIMYNQFVQTKNQIQPGRESIVIDNSAIAGDLDSDHPMNVYLIRSKSSTGNYTYFERKDKQSYSKGGDETYTTSVSSDGTAIKTDNVAGSYVYEVAGNNNQTYYLYPSVMISSSDADYNYIKNSFAPDTQYTRQFYAYKDVSGNAQSSGSAGTQKLYEYYTDVYSTLSPSLMFGDPDLYEQKTGEGNLSYRARDISGKGYFEDRNGGTVKKMYPGDIVYQQSNFRFVYPDGSVAKTAPDIRYYDIVKPSKVEYDSSKPLNVIAQSGSKVTPGLLNIYTNLTTTGTALKSDNNPTRTDTNMPNPIVDAGEATSGANTNAQTVSTITLDRNVFMDLKDDKSNANDRLKRMYHITVELYRVEGSGQPRRVLTLESGKEG